MYMYKLNNIYEYCFSDFKISDMHKLFRNSFIVCSQLLVLNFFRTDTEVPTKQVILVYIYLANNYRQLQIQA